MRPDLIADLFEKEGSYWWNVSKREMVLALVNITCIQKDPGRMGIGVDIGCGTGYTTMVFESDWQMVGADVSQNALGLCKRRGLQRLCQLDVTNFSLPFKTGSIDLILALDVVEHVEDDIHALTECYRILKTGGSLVITVPAFMALWSPWDESLGHRRRYTEPQLIQALRTVGFSVKISAYIFFFVFPVAVLIRSVKRLFQKNATSYSSDFIALPHVLNTFLIHVGHLERWVTTKLNFHFPFGLSVISVAKKK
jgi:SAM-dependent methyltransferase